MALVRAADDSSRQCTHMYQGTLPFSVALLMESVQIEFVYPSQLQLSCSN